MSNTLTREEKQKIIDQLFRAIRPIPTWRICTLPIEWDFKDRLPDLIKTFYVTKPLTIIQTWNDSKNQMQDQSLLDKKDPRLFAQTFVVDLIVPPVGWNVNFDREIRFKWLRELKENFTYINRSEFLQERGDRYIVDYDITKIVEAIDAVKR